MAEVLVFTQNPGFTGRRNAGRHSADFYQGVASVPQEKAEVLMINFGYLCPQLKPKDTVDVIRIYGKRGSSLLQGTNPDESKPKTSDEDGSASASEKVEVEFVVDLKIGKNEFKAGDRTQFKSDYAIGLQEKGKVKIVETA